MPPLGTAVGRGVPMLPATASDYIPLFRLSVGSTGETIPLIDTRIGTRALGLKALCIVGLFLVRNHHALLVRLGLGYGGKLKDVVSSGFNDTSNDVREESNRVEAVIMPETTANPVLTLPTKMK